MPRGLAGDRQGLHGSPRGILAGGIVALVLSMTAGMLLETRRARSPARPVASHYAELEALWLLPTREVEHDA